MLNMPKNSEDDNGGDGTPNVAYSKRIKYWLFLVSTVFFHVSKCSFQWFGSSITSEGFLNMSKSQINSSCKMLLQLSSYFLDIFVAANFCTMD